jgi:hypothetical protein
MAACATGTALRDKGLLRSTNNVVRQRTNMATCVTGRPAQHKGNTLPNNECRLANISRAEQVHVYQSWYPVFIPQTTTQVASKQFPRRDHFCVTQWLCSHYLRPTRQHPHWPQEHHFNLPCLAHEENGMNTDKVIKYNRHTVPLSKPLLNTIQTNYL